MLQWIIVNAKKGGSGKMEIAAHITTDPNIHHGALVIAGTRVPVSIIVGSLAGGMSKEEVMDEYNLERNDVESALVYAADLVAQTVYIPMAAAMKR
jgi:uncharacterized protein (DUF433 family)